MRPATKGAWVVHHSNKLMEYKTPDDFENTYLSGRAGVLLSAISQDNEISIDNERVDVIANLNNIPKYELSHLLNKLSDQSLIEVGKSGIAVLGLTTSTTLEHTSTIFESSEPSNIERAALYLAEKTSEKPITEGEFAEEITDIFKISPSQYQRLLNGVNKFALVDSEGDKADKLYFNGNLFRSGDIAKVSTVLNTLSHE